MGKGAHAPPLLRGELAERGAEILEEGVGLLGRRGHEEDRALPDRADQLRRRQGLGGAAEPAEPDRPAARQDPLRQLCETANRLALPRLLHRHRFRNAARPRPPRGAGGRAFRARVYPLSR